MKLREPSSLLADLPRGAGVLIVRLRSLGDIVLETPVIAALHAWRPDLRISVLVEPRFAAVLEGNPAVTEVLSSGDFWATARELRRRSFAVVFNQHGGPRSALLTAASGSARRVCWKGFQFSALYNVRVPDVKEFYGVPLVHVVEHRMAQLYWTGLPRGPIPRAEVFPQPDAMESAACNLAKRGIAPGEPYAVLQPGARMPEMRWPVEKFAAVSRWLRTQHGMASVVNVGQADAEIAAAVRKEMGEHAVVPEPLNLRELIAVVAGARLFVGNDSGPAHLAAATGRPSVVIFSLTNPVQWRPWQGEYRVVHTGAVFRSRPNNRTFAEGEGQWASAISVEEVQRACAELLPR